MDMAAASRRRVLFDRSYQEVKSKQSKPTAHAHTSDVAPSKSASGPSREPRKFDLLLDGWRSAK
jgi:hypothetical protein